MNRKVTQTSVFSRKLAELIKTRRLVQKDFDDFKRKIAEYPELGDIVQGTGGIRKTRLKSASGGKSGGFRVCYYFHDVDLGEIFLITIYAKNEKEDITPNEKKDLKNIVDVIKGK
jgi:mRNA-degrading endonuclease RelE of RelBE toxin-antitoxin system